jgi:2-dehydropantoate 2-reductase
MRILVYGTGAVGAFFGGLLARAALDVHFVARGAQLEAIRRTGIRIRSTTLGDLVIPIASASSSASDAGPVDLALVCVKTHQTGAILDDLAAAVHDGTTIVPLQNGVEGDATLAARFGAERVVAAVVYVGATLEEPGVVSHVAAGTIGVGAPPGVDARRLAAVRDVLARTGQPVHVSHDIERERWNKLLWNAAFNTVSALTGRDPATLLALPPTRALITAIMREAVAVGRAGGIDLRDADVDAHIAWTERAPGLRTSTMIDRQRGRTMETDALIGVVVRKGRAAGVPTPCSEVVYALLDTLNEVGSRK